MSITIILQLIRSHLGMAKRTFVTRFRYWRTIRRLRAKPKGKKIRVLFLNSETSKWKCQSLYRKMQDSGIFNPIIGITALGEQSTYSDSELENVFTASERFFDNLGDTHVRTVKLKPRRYSDLNEFSPDIVFFPEPWNMQSPQTTENLSRIALVCYVSYFVEPCINTQEHIRLHCLMDMHRFLHTYFVQSEELLNIFQKELSIVNHSYYLIAVGHPALDYLTNSDGPRESQTKNVIYAPHFSIKPAKGRGSLYLRSTFEQTGEIILEYAQKHPEVKWVFKPHPKLRKFLEESGNWSRQKVDEYFFAWERIATCCYDGNYQVLFAESKAMITDSSSFLIEYGLTGKPLIRMIPTVEVSQFLPSVKALVNSFYNVRSVDELIKAMDMVIVQNKDPMKEIRANAICDMKWARTNAAENIVNYFRSTLNR